MRFGSSMSPSCRGVSLFVEQRPQNPVHAGVLGYHFAADRPGSYQIGAVGKPEYFLDLRRNQQHAGTLPREVEDEFVNAAAGAEIDAAARLVEDDEPWTFHDPFGQQHLLLVAAGIIDDLAVDLSRVD